MEIVPSQPFTIWRKLEDPNDSTTYYVKADIRDMVSNTLIDSVNLTDRGSRIFSKQIDAPGDSSGQGRWIAISTRVYTDSGYTTLSAIHKEESREYKVITQRTSFGGGSSSATSIDYEKIKKMMKTILVEELKKLPKEEKISLVPVLNRIQNLTDLISAIDIPKTDLSSVIEAITEAESHLRTSINFIPKPVPVDLNPLMLEIQKIGSLIPESSSKLMDFLEVLRQFIAEHAETVQNEVSTAVQEIKQATADMSNVSFTVIPSAQRQINSTPDLNRERARRLV
jgi:hypothetical protein